MTDISRFDCIKRLDPHVNNSHLSNGYESWRVLGGISYSFKQNQDRININVPNYFVTIGPIIPIGLSKRLSFSDPVFKAGIIHDYLCYRLKVRVNTEIKSITRSIADDIYLRIMKDLKVPFYKRYFYFIMAKFKKYPESKQYYLF